MSKIRAVLAFAAGFVVASTPVAVATVQKPGTLQQCASMLPPGKVYTFQVSGTIDTTGGAPEVRGSMQVDDGTKVDRAREFDQNAFGACIAAFLG